jgi:hypothetical protein
VWIWVENFCFYFSPSYIVILCDHPPDVQNVCIQFLISKLLCLDYQSMILQVLKFLWIGDLIWFSPPKFMISSLIQINDLTSL